MFFSSALKHVEHRDLHRGIGIAVERERGSGMYPV